MSVYRPTYTDKATGETKQQRVWWYHFSFAGRHIQESSKSTRKTIATEAEKKRRLELERGFNDTEDRRHERVRSVSKRPTFSSKTTKSAIRSLKPSPNTRSGT